MLLQHTTAPHVGKAGRRQSVVAPTTPSAHKARSARQNAAGLAARLVRDGVVVRFKEGDAQDATPTLLDQVKHIGSGISGKAPVMFQLNKKCNFGDAWGVCGSIPELGAWDTTKALPLKWSLNDRWFTVVHLPWDQEVEFKYVLLDANKHNTFKGWANDAVGNHNIKMYVRAGNDLELGGTGVVRVLREQQASVITPGADHAETISTTTATTTTTTSPSTETSHEHPSLAERARSVVKPIVSQVSGELKHTSTKSRKSRKAKTGAFGTVGFDTQLQTSPASTSATPTGYASLGDAVDLPTTTPSVTSTTVSGPYHTSGTLPDADPADPANQMVMLPDQAREPQVHRHIVSDTLTTDSQLAGSHVEPHQLGHLDQSSLHYRAPHTTDLTDYTVPSPGATHTPPLSPTPTPLTSAIPGPTGLSSGGWGAGGVSDMGTSAAASPDIGPFTMGSAYGLTSGPTYGDMGQHDASLVAASGGADAFAPRQEPPITGDAARVTMASEAGLDVPVSAEAATAATVIGNIVGGDEEFPEAPLLSGITPVEGAHAASLSANVLNPKQNPLVMAASVIFSPARSLLGKVMGYGGGESNVATHATNTNMGYGTTPEEREMPLETASAQNVGGSSGAGEEQQEGYHRAPESGTEREEHPFQRDVTPVSAGEEEQAVGQGIATRSEASQKEGAAPESGTART